MNKKILFFKIIAFILIVGQTNLFAPKGGGGVCHSSGDSYTGRGDCFSGFGAGECAAPCIGGGGYSAGDNGATGHGGFAGSGSSGGYDSRDTISIPGLRGAALELAAQEVEAVFRKECWVVRNNGTPIKACTRKEVLNAVESVKMFNAGVAAKELDENQAHAMIMELIGLGIPLDCAVAHKAPEEQCLDVRHFEPIHTIMKDFEKQKQEALEGQAQRIVRPSAGASDGMHMFPDISLEALLSECYNDVGAGKRTEADAKKTLVELHDQGLSMTSVRDAILANAQKVGREIEHEMAERRKVLESSKKISQQLWDATMATDDIHKFPAVWQAEITQKFGSLLAYAQYAEGQSGHCVLRNTLHLCYGGGGSVEERAQRVAYLNSLSPDEHQRKLNQAAQDIRLLKSLGL